MLKVGMCFDDILKLNVHVQLVTKYAIVLYYMSIK
jgi:hypothetical protein